MTRKINRRQFVQGTAAAGVGFYIANQYAGAAPTKKSKDQKLNIAVIGCGGRGHANLSQMRDENVVALVDVDKKTGDRGFKTRPDARRYTDYREMYDKEKDLDAIVVSTPDHMHALIAVAGMKRGLHCYCEKPMTWSIEEARMMATIARENGLATQMGNDRCSNAGFRIGAQWLRDGLIGEVREMHVWTNRPVWPQPVEVPKQSDPVPDTLDWDLWLGCSKRRPYAGNRKYMPFNWRAWYDWGTGSLGDMACHTMHLPFLGLHLGSPTSVTAESSKLYPASYPETARIRYDYPERHGLPPVTMWWYDGRPNIPNRYAPPAKLFKDLKDKDGKALKPASAGALIIGSKGTMYAPGDYGTSQKLYPYEKFKDIERATPQWGFTKGHHYEWRMACRGEGKPLSNFVDNAGPFTETVLLGNLALRTGKEIKWDTQALKAKGVPEADKLVRRPYENGYAL